MSVFLRLRMCLLAWGLLISIASSCLLAEDTPAKKTAANTGEPVPAASRKFFKAHCYECHSSDAPESDVILDQASIHWTADTTEYWNRVYEAIRDEAMPPSTEEQPSAAERNQITRWLFDELSRHARVGGTVPRRLNREEYENSMRMLFDYPEFAVPDSFPADDSAHGFDNVGEGLILSPPLMAEYLTLATLVADAVVPPDNGPKRAETKHYDISVDDLANDRAAGVTKIDDVFRIVSSKNMANTAAWPSRFEAPQSGIYRLRLRANVFQTEKMFYEKRDDRFQIAVYARPKTEQTYAPVTELRKIAVLALPSERGANDETVLSCEIALNKGEIFGIRWEDSPCVSAVPSREYASSFFDERLKKDRLHYAAMLKLGKGTRGMSQQDFYLATRALMEGGELDLDDPRLDQLPEKYGGGFADLPHRWVKNYVHEEMFRYGPAVDVIAIEIDGPSRLIEDDEMIRQRKRTARFVGRSPPEADRRSQVANVLTRFLPLAFRRPVDKALMDSYIDHAMGFLSEQSDARIEDALHLSIRRALVSPNFIYRSPAVEQLDDFALASRLSYFLTSSPPDEKLRRLAQRGELSDADTLKAQTMRLLEDPRNEKFVRSFTGQWLGTRKLQDIMPDPRLAKFFEGDRKALINETEMFFTELLRENHSVRDMIDPGFSFGNALTNKIYGGTVEGNEMRRVSFDRGGRRGGILTLGSVMMATANGVDTHPVHRGVWLLENVLGTPTPSPPDNIPAIAPDTTGTHSIRSLLDAHRADESCARCHAKIDPLGMVMENFDPIGRWREFYPIYAKPKDGEEKLKVEFYSTIGEGVLKGPKVDSVGVLDDGTRLENVVDLKRYVLDNIDLFTRCLAEKLMVYATGREMSFGDDRVIDQIVANSNRGEQGVRDLVVAVVLSDSFRSN